MTLDDKIIIPDYILFQVMDEGAAVLNINTEHYFGLDQVGVHIWQVIVETGTARAALDKITRLYDVPEETVRQDILTLLDDLRTAGLINVET